ncbi:MAG TPA: hypothetical protein VG993_09920 [Actinomycetota bacterium]|jgi:hypothetical protein|nr:hypothetical protein [Actinomycetota bacterium]
MASSVAKAGGRRTLLDRVLRREPGERPLPIDVDPDSIVDRGDDVWKSLRF